MREGRQLLSNLEASKAVEGAAAEDRDISQDKERVERYVGLLLTSRANKSQSSTLLSR